MPAESLDYVAGNHEGPYLAKGIEIVSRLLKRGGLLILDDVSESWVEIEKVFATLDRASYARLGTDGRVGVAERI